MLSNADMKNEVESDYEDSVLEAVKIDYQQDKALDSVTDLNRWW